MGCFVAACCFVVVLLLLLLLLLFVVVTRVYEHFTHIAGYGGVHTFRQSVNSKNH